MLKQTQAEVASTEKGSPKSWLGIFANGHHEKGDIAANFLATIDSNIAETPISEQEERKLRWKIDWILIPLLGATVILAAVDKVIISNAAIYGMRTETYLAANEYSWVGSIFYFGYLIWEFPSAYFTQRLPVAKFMAGNVAACAVLMLCTASTQNFGGLATCRFLMGMAEVPVMAVCSTIVAMWWKKSEQPIRMAFCFNQGSSIFAGLIGYGIGHTNTSVSPWRLMFLVLGTFSLLWAGVLWAFLPDSPVSCWYLSDREKYVCIQRVRDNNTGLETKQVKWYQVRECLLDPKTWLLALFAVAQNIPNGGLITFSSIIVSGLGYSKLVTTLLGIPTGIIATAWQLVFSYLVSRMHNARCVTIAVINTIPLICAILMWKLARENKQGLLAAYYCFYTYWGPYVLATSLPLGNCSGHSKKLTMNAVWFFAYCIGNIIGPQAFQSNDAPEYSRGYEGLLSCIVVATASILGYGWLCFQENKRRDQKEVFSETEQGAQAFSDLTDKEKPAFRYIF